MRFVLMVCLAVVLLGCKVQTYPDPERYAVVRVPCYLVAICGIRDNMTGEISDYSGAGDKSWARLESRVRKLNAQ